MFGWLKNLFNGSAAKLVDVTMKGLDNLFTSKEEKLKVRAVLEKQIQKYNLDLMDKINREQEQITERHKTDMKSDSWLSKNIRPLSLIFIMGLYTIFSIISGNIGEFRIDKSFIELLGRWGMLIMSFYFGGRSFEKWTAIKKRKNES